MQHCRDVPEDDVPNHQRYLVVGRRHHARATDIRETFNPRDASNSPNNTSIEYWLLDKRLCRLVSETAAICIQGQVVCVCDKFTGL